MRSSTMAISQWPILAVGQTYLARFLRIARIATTARTMRAPISAALLLAAFFSALLISLEILCSPWPALLALAVGVSVRCLGQQWNRQQARRSSQAAELAGFSFDGHVIRCDFADSAIRSFTSAWKWRIAAAVAAGLTCLTAQHLHAL